MIGIYIGGGAPVFSYLLTAHRFSHKVMLLIAKIRGPDFSMSVFPNDSPQLIKVCGLGRGVLQLAAVA